MRENERSLTKLNAEQVCTRSSQKSGKENNTPFSVSQKPDCKATNAFGRLLFSYVSSTQMNAALNSAQRRDRRLLWLEIGERRVGSVRMTSPQHDSCQGKWHLIGCFNDLDNSQTINLGKCTILKSKYNWWHPPSNTHLYQSRALRMLRRSYCQIKLLSFKLPLLL